MSRKVILVAVLVVLLALPLAVYAEVEPEVEAKNFVDAVNAGDAAAASAFVAEDAVATVPQAMTGDAGAEGQDPAAEQQAVGKAEVEAWIEGLTEVNAETTLGECVVEGEIVICDAVFISDKLNAMGVGEIEGELKIQVNAEGLIQTFDFVASAESTANLQAAAAEAGAAEAAPATLAETGGENLLPFVLILLLGGLLVTGGLGLQRAGRRVH